MSTNASAVSAVSLIGIAIVAGAGLIAAGVLTPTSGEYISQKFKDQAVSPSVQLGKFCSGTIFDKKPALVPGRYQYKVLTAKHCVNDLFQPITINIPKYEGMNPKGDESYDGVVTKISKESDLAIIQFGTEDTLPMATVAPPETHLEFGQKVYSVSFPANFSKTLTEGNLGYIQEGAFQEVSISGRFTRATPSTLGGSSGSGLFVKVGSDYELIGTLTGGLRGNSYTNFYTPLDEVRKFISEKE